METLAERIGREGPIQELDAVGWAIRLAKRLEVLHALGVAHGSISPACILTVGAQRDSQGTLADVQRTSTSLAFQSPERILGGDLSPADDTWAVGATLYVALTGSPPFAGAGDADTRQKILAASPPPLAVFDVGDDDLQHILDSVFARDPSRRLSTVGGLRRVLEEWHPDREVRKLGPLDEEDASDDENEFDEDMRTVMRVVAPFAPAPARPAGAFATAEQHVGAAEGPAPALAASPGAGWQPPAAGQPAARPPQHWKPPPAAGQPARPPQVGWAGSPQAQAPAPVQPPRPGVAHGAPQPPRPAVAQAPRPLAPQPPRPAPEPPAGSHVSGTRPGVLAPQPVRSVMEPSQPFADEESEGDNARTVMRELPPDVGKLLDDAERSAPRLRGSRPGDAGWPGPAAGAPATSLAEGPTEPVAVGPQVAESEPPAARPPAPVAANERPTTPVRAGSAPIVEEVTSNERPTAPVRSGPGADALPASDEAEGPPSDRGEDEEDEVRTMMRELPAELGGDPRLSEVGPARAQAFPRLPAAGPKGTQMMGSVPEAPPLDPRASAGPWPAGGHAPPFTVPFAGGSPPLHEPTPAPAPLVTQGFPEPPPSAPLPAAPLPSPPSPPLALPAPSAVDVVVLDSRPSGKSVVLAVLGLLLLFAAGGGIFFLLRAIGLFAHH